MEDVADQQPADPVEQPTPAEQQPEPIVEQPAPVTADQVIVLSDVQFAQVQDGLTWITAGLFAILGALLILGFWSGWRSQK